MRVTVDRRRSPHWRLFDVIFFIFHFHFSLKAFQCHLFCFSLSLFIKGFSMSSFQLFIFWLFPYSYHLLGFSQCNNFHFLCHFVNLCSLKLFISQCNNGWFNIFVFSKDSRNGLLSLCFHQLISSPILWQIYILHNLSGAAFFVIFQNSPLPFFRSPLIMAHFT